MLQGGLAKRRRGGPPRGPAIAEQWFDIFEGRVFQHHQQLVQPRPEKFCTRHRSNRSQSFKP